LSIHSTAIVDPGASIHPTAVIGPYAVIGDEVTLGAGTRVQHHASVLGPAVLGRDNHLFPFASLGTAPQDLGYKDEPTRLEVGDRNVFREFVTVNRGTVKGGGITRIGNDCMIGGVSGVAKDVPPFMIASGERAKLYSLNLVGLRRNGFTPDQITQLKRAYRLLFRSRLTLKEAMERVAEELRGAEEIEELLDFIRASSRGICRQ
jgi:UDP-N-acetylglucosamine acyltransferase